MTHNDMPPMASLMLHVMYRYGEVGAPLETIFQACNEALEKHGSPEAAIVALRAEFGLDARH